MADRASGSGCWSKCWKAIALFPIEQRTNFWLIFGLIVVGARSYDVVGIWNDIVVIVVHVILIHFSTTLETELCDRFHGLAFNTLLLQLPVSLRDRAMRINNYKFSTWKTVPSRKFVIILENGCVIEFACVRIVFYVRSIEQMLHLFQQKN